MGLAILILVIFQVLAEFNRPHPPPPPLIPSAKMKIRKEEQPIRSIYHLQESPRFALHGRHSTDILAQHSRLALSGRLMLSQSFMTSNTLNMMHYNWAGRYYGLGLGYGRIFLCQVCFEQKYH